MKVYKFFKVPPKDEDNIDLERKYVLYAITNNREYAERFKEDRNMKKFIIKTHKGVSKEEYIEMCNNDRGAVLELNTLTTVFDDNHTSNNSVEKKVLMTYWERQLIEEPNTLLDNEHFWAKMPFPLIFKTKYIKTLEVFQYINYYKLMTSPYLPYGMSERLNEHGDDTDYSAPSILLDEVSLFIQIIQDTL